MRRSLRGLALVLGMLWVAASADAWTMWNGPGPSRLSFADDYDEDYWGVVDDDEEDSGLVYSRRPVYYGTLGFPFSYRDPRFGRRDYVWYPFSTSRPSFFHPLIPLTPFPGFRGRDIFIGRFPEFDDDDEYDDLSWRMLRYLVTVPRLYPTIPAPNLHDRRWGGVTITIVGPDDSLLDENGGGSEGRAVLRTQPEPISVESNSAPVPEPATGALLLAGLCALAARRRGA